MGNTTRTEQGPISQCVNLHERVRKQAAQDLRMDAVPEVSDIVLASSSAKYTSLGEFVKLGEAGATVHAFVPVTLDVVPAPPTFDGVDLDHSNYEKVLTTLLRGELAAQLKRYKEEREKTSMAIQASIETLKLQLNNAKKRQTEDGESVKRHIAELKEMFQGSIKM